MGGEFTGISTNSELSYGDSELLRRSIFNVAGSFLVLPFLGCSVLTKENLQIYQGFSFPAERGKPLEKQEKRPILARKFLAKNQPKKSKRSGKGRTGFGKSRSGSPPPPPRLAALDL